MDNMQMDAMIGEWIMWLVRQDEQATSRGATSTVLIATLGVVIGLMFFIFVFILVRIVFHRHRPILAQAPLHLHANVQGIGDNTQHLHQHHIGNLPPPSLVRLQRLATTTPGLSMQELDSVAPMQVYKEDEEKDVVCPICLDNLQVHDKIRRLPCGHPFHVHCIDEWASKANRCPVCNVPIIADDVLHKQRLNALGGEDVPGVEVSAVRGRRRRRRDRNGAFTLEHHVEDVDEIHNEG